jgi:hypothetical protein
LHGVDPLIFLEAHLRAIAPQDEIEICGGADHCVRMSMRRFTRLTNAFSKKLENLQAAVALRRLHW